MCNSDAINKYRVIVAGSRFGKVFDLLCKFEKKKNRECYGMRLPEWKSDVVIRVQFPDECSKMSAPYLYVESRFGRVPWKETYIELFAENWQLVRLRQPAKTVEDIKNSIMNMNDINKIELRYVDNKQDEAEYQNQMNKETIDSIKKQQAAATPCCDCQCKKEDSSDNKIANFSDFIEKYIESINFGQINTSIDDILKMLD
jgi:hypothetical protein